MNIKWKCKMNIKWKLLYSENYYTVEMNIKWK